MNETATAVLLYALAIVAGVVIAKLAHGIFTGAASAAPTS